MFSAVTAPIRERGDNRSQHVSLPTAELSAPTPATPQPARWAAAGGIFGARRFYLALIVGALTIGALSLLIPSTPSYDPWAWLVWGREIIHLNLHTTGGPSWKPLPVIFTTVFALFGKAQPDLWLVVARAGAVMAAVMVFKIALRLTQRLGVGVRGGDAAPDRAAAWLAPALLAGVIAAVTLVFSDGFVADNALGYSEGLMTALVLIAVERHLDGSPRQAFAVGFVAALDRPEIWLFWGPYGLWLAWKDPGARKLVLGLFALIPVLWFLPEYWGSGHFLRGVNRAQHPRANSAAHAKCPFCAELVHHAWPGVLLRIKVAAAIGVLVAAVAVLRGGLRNLLDPNEDRNRAMALLAAAGVVGFGWWVLIAVLTQAGFSGNDRYLVLGAALIDVAGAVALGWGAYALAGLVRRRLSARDRDVPMRGMLWGTTGLAVLVFVFIPNPVTGNLIDIQRTHRALVYQAHLRQDISKAVAKLGGPANVLACGTVMTEGFQVPMLAWTLGVHTVRIQAPPDHLANPGPAPNVIFQTRAQRHAHLLPFVRAWPGAPYRLVAHVRTFRVFAQCAGRLTL